jgi:hypothetical protein
MKYIIIFSSILLSLFIANCRHSTSTDENTDWIKGLIIKYQNEPVGNPPQSIWQYDYKGQIVYFVPQQCCDQPSTLYDAKRNVICAPDGGFFGHGDGNCPDFFQERKNEELIWKDSRTH